MPVIRETVWAEAVFFWWDGYYYMRSGSICCSEANEKKLGFLWRLLRVQCNQNTFQE